MSFKKFVGKLSDTLNIGSNAIKTIIKETNLYLNAELTVAKQSKEAISALKSYAESETEGLSAAINNLAESFEMIENSREQKVAGIREEYVTPLEELLIAFESQQKELRDAEKAKDNLEKAEKKLNKLEEKASSKPLKPGVLDSAEADVKSAERIYTKKEEDAKLHAEAFNKKKLEILQLVLKKIVEIEINYHKDVLSNIESVKKTAKEINIEKETKVVEPEDNLDE